MTREQKDRWLNALASAVNPALVELRHYLEHSMIIEDGREYAAPHIDPNLPPGAQGRAPQHGGTGHPNDDIYRQLPTTPNETLIPTKGEHAAGEESGMKCDEYLRPKIDPSGGR